MHPVAISLFVALAVQYATADLASYIKPCSASDPKFNECVLRSARASMKRFAKGDPVRGIPSMDPMYVKEIKALGSSGGGLRVILQDAKLLGTSDLDMKKFKIDLVKKKITARAVGDLRIDATYDLSGRILIIPLYGKGHADVLLRDVKLGYSFDYDIVTKADGKHYLEMLKDNLKYEIGGAAFNLENLFNGDKVLGESTKRLLNDSWRDIIAEVGPPVAKVLGDTFQKAIKKFLSTVTHDELLLP